MGKRNEKSFNSMNVLIPFICRSDDQSFAIKESNRLESNSNYSSKLSLEASNLSPEKSSTDALIVSDNQNHSDSESSESQTASDNTSIELDDFSSVNMNIQNSQDTEKLTNPIHIKRIPSLAVTPSKVLQDSKVIEKKVINQKSNILNDSISGSKKQVKFRDSLGEPLEELFYVETLYSVPENPFPCHRSTTKREMNYEDIELKFSDDSSCADDEFEYIDGALENLKENTENVIISGMLWTMRQESSGDSCDEGDSSSSSWLRIPSWSWTKKWCELRIGALAYYSNKQALIPLGVIPTAHSKARVADPHHFTFRIYYYDKNKNCCTTRNVNRGGKWKEFRCHSKQEMHDWIQAINTASCVDFIMPMKDLVRKLNNKKTKNKKEKGATHLLLIRHGQTKNMLFRTKDKERGLTTLGRHQAHLTGEYLEQFLADRQVDIKNVTITHSGLARTLETSEIIQKHLPEAEIQSCTLLKEGMSHSFEHYDDDDLESERIARLKMAYRSFCVHSNKKIIEKDHPQNKNLALFEQVFDPCQTGVRYGDCYKIIVCHANVIHYFVSRTMGLSEDKISGSMVLNHCSVTQVDVNPLNGVVLHSVNHCGHLPADLQTEN